MSSSDSSRSPLSSASCPRCGNVTAHPFAGGGGVCLRCAGERAFALGTETPFESLNPGEDFAAAAQADTTSLDTPARIGPYEIIEELGRGGMGRVFAARQRGLGRIVALKVLSLGPGAPPELEMRFLREAQTVASLRHPHIISIYDSGRAAGYAYFSMDYLEAGDLSRRLRERPLTPREAAALVAKVAGALAHAHAAGVLHRDLKPSNILLDGDEPRLADFGLAAQLETSGDLTSASGIFGTPHYLAPEALRGGGAAVTAASDLYALGVVLYALLTGRTPFAGASPAELPGLVHESDPPAPRLLAPAVPRDLETICLKCLERDPVRRYSGATALAEDLRHFLAGEPILASPPGRADRFRRFVRRYRTAVVATGAVVATLAAATVTSTTLAIRARRAERHSAAEYATSHAVLRFLQDDLLLQGLPGAGTDKDLKLRTVIDRAAQRIDGRFAESPLVEAALRDTLGRTYISLGVYADAHRHLARALELRTEQLGRDQLETLDTMAQLLDCEAKEGKNADGEILGTELVERTRRIRGTDHPDTLHAMDLLALLLRYQSKYDRAEPLQVAALTARRRVQGPQHPDLLLAMENLAMIYARTGRPAAAEKLAVECADIETRALGAEHPDTLSAVNNLGLIYREAGKFAEAEKLYLRLIAIRERQLGPDHHDTLISMNNLAITYRAEGRLDDAERTILTALERLRRSVGEEHRDTLISTGNLAGIYKQEGKLDQALALARHVAEVRARVLGAEHIDTLLTRDNVGDILIRKGDFAAAEPIVRDILAIRRKNSPQHFLTPATASQLGLILIKQQRYAEAEPLLLQAYADLTTRTAQIGTIDRGFIDRAAERLAELYAATGRPAESAAWRAKVTDRPPATKPSAH